MCVCVEGGGGVGAGLYAVSGGGDLFNSHVVVSVSFSLREMSFFFISQFILGEKRMTLGAIGGGWGGAH